MEQSAASSRQWNIIINIRISVRIKILFGYCAILTLPADTAVHTVSETITVITIRSGKIKYDYRMTSVFRTAPYRLPTDLY